MFIKLLLTIGLIALVISFLPWLLILTVGLAPFVLMSPVILLILILVHNYDDGSGRS